MIWYLNYANMMDDEPGSRPPNHQLPVWTGYVATILIEAILTGVLLLSQPNLPLAQFPIPYALVLMLVAYLFGEGPAILAFFLGLFAFDYFFVPPLYTPLPHAETPLGWAGLIAYLIGASIVGFATIMIRRGKRRVERIARDLRESQQDLNRAQAVAHTGSWRLDVRRDELLWSDEVYRIFGIPRETLMTYETFLAAVYPDDREYVDQKWNAALRGETYDVEHRICVDHTTKWVRERAELEFDQQGGLLGGFGTVQDITDLKKAEEALRESEERFFSAFEYAAIGMALVSPEGRLLRVNRAFCELVGYSKDELLARTFQDITHPDDLEADLGHVRQMLSGEIDTYQMEKRYIHKSGRVVWVLLSVSMVRDTLRKPLYFISQIQDITERKQGEEALREEQEHKLEFYRRTIEAATGGKLIVTERPEIERIAGEPVGTWEIRSPDDIKFARHGVEEIAHTVGMEDARIGQLLVCVGEAGTNVVKHAGQGEASLHQTQDSLIVVVSDRGPGIPALALPQVALRRGYSTAGTLGMGYKMMIQFADRVYLATGDEGTTVAVEMNLHPAETPPAMGLMERLGL